MNSILLRVFFLLVLWLITHNIHAQRFIYQNFTTEDGLPSSECYDVVQDSLGYIWIATDKGVVKYNGHDFKVFDVESGLKSSTVFRLFAKNNRIWFFTYNKYLQFIENDSIHTPTYSSDLKQAFDSLSASPNSFSVNSNNEILIALSQPQPSSQHLIFKVSQVGLIQFISSDPHYKEFILYKEAGHNVCFGTYKGCDSTLIPLTKLSIKINGRVDTFFVRYRRNYSTLAGQAFASSDENQIELISTQDLMYRFWNNKISDSLPVPNLISNSMFNFDTNIYGLGIQGKGLGLITVSDSIITNFDTSNFELNSISGGMIDSENGCWLTSLQNGIFYIPNRNIKQFTLKWLDEPIFKITKSEGKIWVYTTSENLYVIDIKQNNIVAQYRPKNMSLLNFYQNTYEGQHELKKRLQENKFTLRHVTSKGSQMVGDSTWFVRNQEFGVYYKDEIIFSSINHLQTSKKYTFLYKTSNNLYIGTLEGILKYDLDEMSFDKSFIRLNNYRINEIETFEKNFLIATGGGGLVLMDEHFNTIKIFSEKDGLSSNNIASIHKESEEVFWLGTNKGLTRVFLPLQNWENNFEIQKINKTNGLLSDEVSDVNVANNIIYVGTKKGLCFFNYLDMKLNEQEPSIQIESIVVNRQFKKSNSNLRLSHLQNEIQIELAGLTFKDPKNRVYKYRLTTDSDTSNWITINHELIQFSELAPGAYYFEAKAVNNDGVWSKTPATLSFTISPPWWNWWLPITIFYLLLGLLIYITARWRLSQIKKRNDLEIRTRELKQMALTAQLNPHFIFNAMGSIQSLILKNKLIEAEDYLTGLAKLMRTVLNKTNEPFSSIASEIQIVTDYVKLENLRFSDSIDCQFTLDKNIDQDRFKIPAMLMQTLVENAIIHGILPAKKKGAIFIRIILDSTTEGTLLIEIEDNGVGINYSKKASKKQIFKHKSAGMDIVRQRLTTYSELYDNQFFIEFIDLSELNKEQSGTIVKMKLPYYDE
ncbi:MAG: histidine kinase [Flavobacteriales bacterium]|nr:histidine kinase [Flavobacteriales bacterium]